MFLNYCGSKNDTINSIPTQLSKKCNKMPHPPKQAAINSGMWRRGRQQKIVRHF